MSLQKYHHLYLSQFIKIPISDLYNNIDIHAIINTQMHYIM